MKLVVDVEVVVCIEGKNADAGLIYYGQGGAGGVTFEEDRRMRHRRHNSGCSVELEWSGCFCLRRPWRTQPSFLQHTAFCPRKTGLFHAVTSPALQVCGESDSHLGI